MRTKGKVKDPPLEECFQVTVSHQPTRRTFQMRLRSLFIKLTGPCPPRDADQTRQRASPSEEKQETAKISPIPLTWFATNILGLFPEKGQTGKRVFLPDSCQMSFKC